MADPASSSHLPQHGDLVVDPAGDEVGHITEIYVDADTGAQQWALVRLGLIGGDRLVPLSQATRDAADVVRVPYYRDVVRSAPKVPTGRELSPDQETELARHYDRVTTAAIPEAETAAEVVRVEEELVVRTEAVPHERVRLRKHVVTEEVTQTVTVRREELRIEREAVPEGERETAPPGTRVEAGEQTIVLYEEVPIVAKKVVPVERIRLRIDVATDEVEVVDEVRKERVDVEDEPAGESHPTGYE
jgi:stress response protein YsnF